MKKIETLAQEIADAIMPLDKARQIEDVNPAIRELLLEFAKEVKRASLEGEW